MKETTLSSHKMRCPLCGKRVFDITELPGEQVAITLKCPSCHQVVTVRCTGEATLRLQMRPMRPVTYKAVGASIRQHKEP